MDSSIERILDDILRREGGWTNNPADRGGPTNFGITLPTLSEELGRPATVAELRALNEDQARVLYRERYIDGPGFSGLFSGPLLELVVDTAVNNGRARAVRWLQHMVGVTEDGILGPKTRAALVLRSAGELYRGLLALRLEGYADLLRAHHEQVVFAGGWLRRVAEFIRKAA